MDNQHRRNQSSGILQALICVSLLVALLCGTPLYAESIGNQEKVNQYSRELANNQDSERVLDELVKTIAKEKINLSTQLQELIAEAQKIEAKLASLGEKIDGEGADVRATRQELEQQRAILNNKISESKVLLIKLDDISLQSTQRIAQLVTRRLLSKGDYVTSYFSSFSDPEINPVWLTGTYLVKQSGLESLSVRHLVWFSIVLMLSMGTAYWIRVYILDYASRRRGEGLGFLLVTSALKAASKYVVSFIGATVLAIFSYVVYMDQSPLPFVMVFSIGLPIVIVCASIIKFIGYPDLVSYLSGQEHVKTSQSIKRRSYFLLIVSFLAYLWLFSLYAQQAPIASLNMVRDAFSVLLVVNLIWILGALKVFNYFQRHAYLRAFTIVVLALILLSELLGYRNLAMSSFRLVMGVAVSFALFKLFSMLVKEFFEAIDNGEQAWHKSLRKHLGIKPGEQVPGLVLFRFLVQILLWLAFLLLVLLLFGVSDNVTASLRQFVIDGASIGSVKIQPVRMLFALITFVLLYMFSGWFKNGLDKNWLSKMRLERGAKEALVTMTGYIGVSIAFVVALGMAGVTFTNLAIIAGALSVGIGFGLQNIVNNFVSGLILLFERPIKTGDWIVVGNTEGYVRKISIRSTQIQTFDLADVIVPNSDLLSNQVTNWMLRDPIGRIRIPIGVAYSSDVRQVERLLAEIPPTMEQIISNNSKYPIRVYFLGFGDSALNFELRCFIKNIDEKLNVTSKINFAIEEKFRLHGISIPFPQRDIHIIQPADLEVTS